MSDSLSESLEPESGSNKKLRLLVVDEDPPEFSEGLENTRIRVGDSAAPC